MPRSAALFPRPLRATLLAALWVPLAGCVSVDLPGIVSDTAKVSKEAYQAIVTKKPAAAPAANAASAPPAPATPTTAPPAPVAATAPATAAPTAPAMGATAPAVQIFHTHVGLDTQPVAELQQRCVQEALDKATLAGLAVRPHRVAETSLVPVPPRVMAHCRLVFEARL
jgi:hypothetical protein